MSEEEEKRTKEFADAMRPVFQEFVKALRENAAPLIAGKLAESAGPIINGMAEIIQNAADGGWNKKTQVFAIKPGRHDVDGEGQEDYYQREVTPVQLLQDIHDDLCRLTMTITEEEDEPTPKPRSKRR